MHIILKFSKTSYVNASLCYLYKFLRYQYNTSSALFWNTIKYFAAASKLQGDSSTLLLLLLSTPVQRNRMRTQHHSTFAAASKLQGLFCYFFYLPMSTELEQEQNIITISRILTTKSQCKGDFSYDFINSRLISNYVKI